MNKTIRVAALDLSLTSTGIANYHSSANEAWTDTIKVKTAGHERLRDISNQIFDLVCMANLVAVEGPSYGSGTTSRQAGHHERAGLWWHITYRLWRNEIPFAVIPPASLKKYIAGRGNASKDEVLLATARRYPSVAVKDNNQADALVMLAMTLDHLGRPLAVVPATHRGALDGVTWPEARQAQ
ncbi:hypothetical protein ACIBH1_05605 [Nonomuraea sp. NPDC050663]|uniref:hypothetical protein n=1 Tax=Nonomuraea sp. NPDC050663 TaxID=3364370 RepID=UPI0037BA850F